MQLAQSHRTGEGVTRQALEVEGLVFLQHVGFVQREQLGSQQLVEDGRAVLLVEDLRLRGKHAREIQQIVTTIRALVRLLHVRKKQE